MSDDQLNDQEWEELQQNRELLKNAVAAHGPEAVKQAIKDAIHFPRRSGDVRK